MHDAIDHHPMISDPQEVFDPLIDSVDFQALAVMKRLEK